MYIDPVQVMYQKVQINWMIVWRKGGSTNFFSTSWILERYSE